MTVQRVAVPDMPVHVPPVPVMPLVMQVVVPAVMQVPPMDPPVQLVAVPVVAVDAMRVPVMPPVVLQMVAVLVVPLVLQVVVPPVAVRVTVPMVSVPAPVVMPAVGHMTNVRGVRDVAGMADRAVTLDARVSPYGRNMTTQMRAAAAPAAHRPPVDQPLHVQHRPALELTSDQALRRLPDSHQPPPGR